MMGQIKQYNIDQFKIWVKNVNTIPCNALTQNGTIFNDNCNDNNYNDYNNDNNDNSNNSIVYNHHNNNSNAIAYWYNMNLFDNMTNDENNNSNNDIDLDEPTLIKKSRKSNHNETKSNTNCNATTNIIRVQ